MEKKIILGVVLAAMGALIIALLIPGGGAPDRNPKLPWQIDLYPGGESAVFGLRLGKSTLNDAVSSFEQDGKATLFLGPEGSYDVEIFFDRLYLSGLRADIVLSLDVDYDSAGQIYQRGLRESKLGSGTRKVEMAPEDQARLGVMPIRSITYIPAADLEPELIASRFDQPDRKITEESGITHWLYPEKGLDIAVNPDGKEIFQYVAPKEFHRITTPLERVEADIRAD